MRKHSSKYHQYINSIEWREKRREALIARGWTCERCGFAPSVSKRNLLQVHHLHYDDFGHESLTSLMVVCQPCHEIVDTQRIEHMNQNRWNRRVNAWADKVFGDGWDAYVDPDYVEEAFETWLDDKGNDVC